MKFKILEEFKIKQQVYNKKKLISDLVETYEHLQKLPNIGTWNNLRQNFTHEIDKKTINSIYEGIERSEKKLKKFLERIKKYD